MLFLKKMYICIQRINEFNLSTMVNEESIKFIVGERPMSEFDSFIAQLEKLNYKKLENIYSEAFKQYKDRIKMIKLYD